jgi:hypothetical protein
MEDFTLDVPEGFTLEDLQNIRVRIPRLNVLLSLLVTPIAPPPTPPNLVITGFSVNPSSIAMGEPWTATATVTNQGGSTGSAEILIGYLLADGTKKPLNAADPGRVLTLGAGATGTVSWSGTGTAKGSWTFYAGEQTAKLLVADAVPSIKQFDALFTVTDKETGSPRQGVAIAIGQLSAETDAAGQAAIGPLEAGVHSYKITMAGYAPLEGQVPAG